MGARKALINDLVDSALITQATAAALHLDPTTTLAVAADLTAQGVAEADAAGGATVDAEARAAINGLLASLRTTGVIAT